jgi:hypothetical protein
MRTWIFQGNPDDYDIDGYLSSRPAQLVWLVTRYASEIAVRDRVYLWRNQGKQSAIPGIIAEGIVTASPELRGEDPEGVRFWRLDGPRATAPQVRAVMRLVKVATAREVNHHFCGACCVHRTPADFPPFSPIATALKRLALFRIFCCTGVGRGSLMAILFINGVLAHDARNGRSNFIRNDAVSAQKKKPRRSGRLSAAKRKSYTQIESFR